MSALAIVQARMSSTRLPGKSLAPVGGEPMLALVLRRLARAREVDEAMVATSSGPEDDAIAEAAGALGHRVHRGPRDDVLRRFAGAAEGHEGEVVRITGDCPLIDPAVVDRTIELFRATPGCAYAQNIEPRTFPDGLDVEVLAPGLLARLDAEVSDAFEREHVTTAVRRQPELFPHATLENAEDLGELRWTVDEPADLEFVRQVVDRLGVRREEASIGEVLEAVRREPSLAGYGGARRG